MSWMSLPVHTATTEIPFDQVRFPDANLGTSLEGYARFVFARVAFVKGTPCALLKNNRFFPKGNLTLLHVRQHVEQEGTIGISLAQKATGLTKTVCAIFKNESVIEAVGQGCRLISSMRQDGLQGLIELCPNSQLRVWAFFEQPLPVVEAVEAIQNLKKRSFISHEAAFLPSTSGSEDYLELPPYPDPETDRWSLMMTLEMAERLLEDPTCEVTPTDWDNLLGVIQADARNPEPRSNIMEVLSSPTSKIETAVQSSQDSALVARSETDQEESLSQSGAAPSVTPDKDDSNILQFPYAGEKGQVEAASEGIVLETGAESAALLPLLDEVVVSEQEPVVEPQEVAESVDREIHEPAIPAREDQPAGDYTLTPLSASIPTIIGQLLNPVRVTIPSPSQSVNEVLNGGWTLQRVYLIAGGSGEGKTTFCAWAADYAASNHVPVVFVSFQAPKELLSIYALSRTARIDSALIERGLCKQPRSRSEDLRKILMNAGRKYFRTGDYLHVLEADLDTTMADIREAVVSTRKYFGLEEGDPVIVVIDSMREIRVDTEKEGKHKTGRSRVSQIMLQMKEIAQTQNAAILVTMDTPPGGGIRTGAGMVEPSEFEVASGLADTCFILDSRAILQDITVDEASLRRRNSSRLQDPLDRVLDQFGQQPVLAKRLQVVRKDYPLEERSAATYARLWTVKNRGGRTDIQPIFRYHRAFHDFEPISLDTTPLPE